MAVMITAFILANDDAKALTRTLNALISATVDGLVREVILIARGANEVATKVADHAGCNLVQLEQFPAAIKAAKGEWLIVFEAGALPELGWVEAVGQHVQSNGATARFTRSPLTPRKLFERWFQPELPLALGLIIEKRKVLVLGEAALCLPENLAKAAKPKTMPAALRPASNAHPNGA